LEDAVVAALAGYEGPVAVMSFNPHSVAHFHKVAPHIPRGLVTCNWNAKDWPTVPEQVRDELRDIPDFEKTGSCFISNGKGSLTNPAVARIKAQGHTILCWTIKTPEQEAKARKIVDNITFEGYLP
jgi:glycerophosphoryl diester phosphodiesterase